MMAEGGDGTSRNQVASAKKIVEFGGGVGSEMERGRSPLVSIPSFGRGFSRQTKPGARRTGGRFVIGLGLYFNPAKLACRNSRPDAVNNATKTPCPMAIFRAR